MSSDFESGDAVRFFESPLTYGIVVKSAHKDVQVAYFNEKRDEVATTRLYEARFYIEKIDVFKDNSDRYNFRMYKSKEDIARTALDYTREPKRWKSTPWGQITHRGYNFMLSCVYNATDLSSLRPGDHIFRFRSGFERGMLIGLHAVEEGIEHGIVFGDQSRLKVIYYSCETSQFISSPIANNFAASTVGVGLAKYDPRFATKHTEDVVELANQYAKGPPAEMSAVKYPNKSEYFALYCKKKIVQPIPVSPRHLTRGDHIFVKDRKQTFRRHGMFISQDEIVLFSGTEQSCSLDNFLAGGTQLYRCDTKFKELNTDFRRTDDSSERRPSAALIQTISPSNLKPGDHIYAYRALGLYQHHGIYIGQNEAGVHIVIHFSGERKSKTTAKIQRASLEEFLGGYTCRLVAYSANLLRARLMTSGTMQILDSLPSKEVIATAEYYAQHPNEWSTYSLYEDNCEMFAIYCKTGIRITGFSQIQRNSILNRIYS